jgi:hypothetical protein
MAMGKLGGIPCCCDEAACYEFSDDFNRANDTDLGANWTETSGDSEIASNKLKMDATERVEQSTADTTLGSDPAYFDLQVTVNAGADNVVVRIGMHDLYAELDWANNTASINGNAAYDWPGSNLAASTNYALRFIWNNDVACLIVNGVCVRTENVTQASLTAGPPFLQVTTNPTPTTVTWDDYSITVKTVDTDCILSCEEDFSCSNYEPIFSECENCEDDTTFRKYQVEIAGVVNDGFACVADCDKYNGTFILDMCDCLPATLPEECGNGGDDPVVGCGCIWSLRFDPAPCTCHNGAACTEHRDWIRLHVATNITVNVQGDGQRKLRFQKAHTFGASCAFNNEDIPVVAGGTLCDRTAVTCKVSAIT